MKAEMFHCGQCWVTDPSHPHFAAGVKATKMVYGIEPDMTREGCSIPITIVLQEVTGKNVLLLPMGACDDGAHSQNEKINRTNYIQGTNSSPRTSMKLANSNSANSARQGCKSSIIIWRKKLHFTTLEKIPIGRLRSSRLFYIMGSP